MDTDSLAFTRTITAGPSHVHKLLTNSKLRQSWNTPGEGVTVTVTHPADAAPGARETSLVTSATDPDTTVHTDWTSVTPELVAYAETLEAEGAPIAASFACAAIEADGTGTRLSPHIALTSFAGPEMLEGYRMGCEAAIDALSRITAAT